eukprot:TRINITY_DN4049_c0_g1_i1.p1 TRINITY_DN4049_c0_g1~~TRINITY_DN4049_c0_g1_i1.p1  ORF type:complete len:628 (+),score=121.19 TRINITY_DN4049_c0_g1_i1:51-1886(+)
MTTTTLKPGAHVTSEGVNYCIWAPDHSKVEVIINDGTKTVPLEPTLEGYHQANDKAGRAGDLYKFRLDGDANKTFPDPASRFQPQGVHGQSQVVDSRQYQWKSDNKRPKTPLDQIVIYEVHIGTFTPEGTYRSAIDRLDHIVNLGANTVEIMPVSDFPGGRNWGYDGVMPYAPSRAYGSPDDLRALIDAGHEKGLNMVLDVVYNHMGPDGNYLTCYSKAYFDAGQKTPWGDALNYGGENSGPVREFFVGNVRYWLEEFHFDGFRFDAIHAIIDESKRHVLSEMAAVVHEHGGFLFGEDERNAAFLATPAKDNGTGFDGLWADDFHHTVRVAITGEQESYLGNFTGTPEELKDTLENGWHYRGQVPPKAEEKHGRGTECKQLPPYAFVYCISNHDQVGNRAFGERVTVSCTPAGYRAASSLLCFGPYTPLLFQGQEWAASTPFLFFTEHNEHLGPLVTEGRRREFKGFAAFNDEESVKRIPDPQAEKTFLDSKLKWEEVKNGVHAQVFELYREALRLRREDPVLKNHSRDNWHVELNGDAIVLTFGDKNDVRKIVLRLKDGSGAIVLKEGGPFRVLFSSNDSKFGGDDSSRFDEESSTLSLGSAGLVILGRK